MLSETALLERQKNGNGRIILIFWGQLVPVFKCLIGRWWWPTAAVCRYPVCFEKLYMLVSNICAKFTFVTIGTYEFISRPCSDPGAKILQVTGIKYANENNEIERNKKEEQTSRKSVSSKEASIYNFSIKLKNAEALIITVQGRVGWALECLIDAGSKGGISILSSFPIGLISSTSCAGVAVETITEPHTGAFAGTHARYVLRDLWERVC